METQEKNVQNSSVPKQKRGKTLFTYFLGFVFLVFVLMFLLKWDLNNLSHFFNSQNIPFISNSQIQPSSLENDSLKITYDDYYHLQNKLEEERRMKTYNPAFHFQWKLCKTFDEFLKNYPYNQAAREINNQYESHRLAAVAVFKDDKRGIMTWTVTEDSLFFSISLDKKLGSCDPLLIEDVEAYFLSFRVLRGAFEIEFVSHHPAADTLIVLNRLENGNLPSIGLSKMENFELKTLQKIMMTGNENRILDVTSFIPEMQKLNNAHDFSGFIPIYYDEYTSSFPQDYE